MRASWNVGQLFSHGVFKGDSTARFILLYSIFRNMKETRHLLISPQIAFKGGVGKEPPFLYRPRSGGEIISLLLRNYPFAESGNGISVPLFSREKNPRRKGGGEMKIGRLFPPLLPALVPFAPGPTCLRPRRRPHPLLPFLLCIPLAQGAAGAGRYTGILLLHL